MDASQNHNFWEEHSNVQHVKYESCNSSDEHSRLKDERNLYSCCDGNLNFATVGYSEDDSEYGSYKKSKAPRQDPMSHRIIEKRRRDRMNNCLADLSRLIPAEYLKKGRGRIEKTEIIEMAIKHMKYLQQVHVVSPSEHYRLGYQECMSETMRFLVEVEGHFPREAICVRLLNHLQKHCETLSGTSSMKRSSVLNICGDAVVLSEDPKLHCAPHTDEEINHNGPDLDICDRHADTNGASYKYKNDIKLRFNQDIQGNNKHQKVDTRSYSTVCSDNYSSPPSSETCTQTSAENEHPIQASPTSSSISTSAFIHKVERSVPGVKNGHVDRCLANANKIDLKSNFSVPIFVLHAKGSFYVPLTIDYNTLVPFLHNYNLLEVLPGLQDIVLHPVTINVNFQTTRQLQVLM